MKLVSKTLAKRLQELGYNGEYNYWLCALPPSNEELYLATAHMEMARATSAYPICAAPYLEQVAEWLREQKHRYVQVRYIEPRDQWDFRLYNTEDRELIAVDYRVRKSYEDALEAGIIRAVDYMEVHQCQVLKMLLDTAKGYSTIPDDICADTKICDTDLDSLDRTCILMDMERLYGIHLDEELFTPEMTFREVAQVLASKLENKSKSES